MSSSMRTQLSISQQNPCINTRYEAFCIYHHVRLTIDNKQVNATSSSGLEHDKKVLRRAFNCEARKAQLPDALWDGGNNAWYVWEGLVLDIMLNKDRSMIDLPDGVSIRIPNARRHTRRLDGKGDAGDNWVQLTMIRRRTLNLAVIGEWLKKRHSYDQYVIEALSK